MLTHEQGAALHGQIANALQDLNDGLVEVAKVRLRRLQELVDDVVPDVDGETPLQEAQREVAHWESVIKKYSGTSNPLDRIQVEEATKLRDEWQGKLAERS